MKREITLFLSITAVLTAGCIAVVLWQDVDMGDLENASALGQVALFGQGFVPGIAALVTRRITSGGYGGLGLRLGAARRYARLAYLVPVGYTAAAYVLLWGSGAADLDTGGGVPEALLGATLGVVPFLVLSLGEEVGWRGLMSARLAEVTTPERNALLTGLAWSAFHMPLLVFVPGAVEDIPLAYAVAMFTISAIALSYPMEWLRKRSGSIWPATLMHASGNAALYLAADPLTGETANSAWFAGETGAFLAVATAAVGLAWWLRAPGVRDYARSLKASA